LLHQLLTGKDILVWEWSVACVRPVRWHHLHVAQMPANAVPCRLAKAKYCGMPAPAAAIAVPCRQRLKPTARILGTYSQLHFIPD
jgi:hypothetical protein